MKFDPGLVGYHMAIRGWDQHQLSRASGVSEATISRVMAGQSMRPLTALQLARAFREHRPVRELIDLVPSPQSLERAA
jgi:transcriptional regulator with XRE-family HTH domain